MTDAGVKELTTLKNLTYLNLGGTEVTDGLGVQSCRKIDRV